MLRIGSCCWRGNQVEPLDDDAHSRSLDRQTHLSKAREQRIVKLLLLGTGESGKSTFAKQLVAFYGTGFTSAERLEYRIHIFRNAFQSIKALLGAVDRFQLESHLDADLKSYMLKVDADVARLNPNIGEMMETAWNDAAVRAVYDRRNMFQLNDSAAYFLNKARLITADSFVPTTEDIMMIRVASTGIVEREFQRDGGNIFRIIDVGGQRNERRKWIHCFDSVTAVIFVVALSEYDQVLYEDDKMNRMIESLNLFGEICNSPYFQNRTIILFLNKIDLFRVKLKTSDLARTFPDYTGGPDPDAAVQFIREKFVSIHLNDASNPIITYVTCNTDPKMVQVVFEALAQAVLRNTLMQAGFT